MSRPDAIRRRSCRRPGLVGPALAALLGVSGFGCSVSALEESEPSIAINECSSNEDCLAGICDESMCVATAGSLSTLLFEVVPSASAIELEGPSLAGVSLLGLVDNVPTAVGSFDLSLAGVATVSGTLSAKDPPLAALLEERRLAFPTANPTLACSAFFEGPEEFEMPVPLEDGTTRIPARVTFVPTERQLGIASAARVDETSEAGFEFRTPLPPGVYDVYAEPHPAADDERCSLPPQLWRNVDLPGETTLNLRMGQPQALEIEVLWPAESGNALTGWTVDMIESQSGRAISTRLGLPVPSCDDTIGQCVYRTVLSYLPVVGGEDENASELIRLTPPEHVVAPTIQLERTALELFAPGSGSIDLSGGLPKPVLLEGQALAAPGDEPIGASVVVRATELEGIPAGMFASFERKVDADEDGRFALELLPGQYRVVAVPVGDRDGGLRLATAEALWEVAAEPPYQAGRLIELPVAHSLRGSMLVPGSGEGVRGAVVNVEVSTTGTSVDEWDRALGMVPVVPRAAGVTIDDESGVFVLRSDFGVFDFSVRPPEASRLAWLVMPGVALDRDDVQPAQLGVLSLPLPVRLRGSVLLGGQESSPFLAGAYVRAYALVDESHALVTNVAEASAAVPVADGRLDANARFTLYVPASLNAAPE